MLTASAGVVGETEAYETGEIENVALGETLRITPDLSTYF